MSTLTALAAATLVVLLSLTIYIPAAPVAAQAQPTATPADPAWLAFSLARAAIQEQENVRLAIVQRWDFYQDDWSGPNPAHPGRITGIDSCVSTVIAVNARDQIFGWTISITSQRGQTYYARVSFDLQDVAVCDILPQAAAVEPTPAPGTTPVAGGSLPTPIPGSAATGRFELGGHVDGLSPQAVDAMKRSGMTWVKKQIGMDAVGIAPRWIADAKANGFKMLFGAVGDKNALAANRDAYIASYASFVAQLATAGADAIEIWNEPNIDREWPAGQINGANYVQLLAAASNAIRQANPNTLIISGAPAPTGFFGAAGCAQGGCNDDVFMQQMAQAGAAQYIDCVGLHYNEGIIAPSATTGDPRGSYPSYYFGSMTARGKSPFPNKPVCYTELGYLSGENMGAAIPGGFAWANQTTVAQQAAWLAEAATIAAQRGDVRIMIVWNINFTRWDSDPMGGYAIIRPDGTLGAVMRR
ncbi:MAG: glycoside hydrolase family 5 protein [Anaerolineae bacterium]|nr:glycoside hydrolase family 5 protein [Anaerolineae bacterium]